MRALLTWELGGGLGHMMNLRPLAAELLLARGHDVYLAAGDLTRAIDVFGDLMGSGIRENSDSPHAESVSHKSPGLSAAADYPGKTSHPFAANSEGVGQIGDPQPAVGRPSTPGLKLLAAPWKTRKSKTTDTIVTFADLLLNIGFGDGNALLAHLAAWRTMFDLVRPDVLVCDHSPTALLAAKTIPVGEFLRNSHAGFGETGLRETQPPFVVATVGTGFFTPPDESPLRLLRPAAEDHLRAARAREAKLLEIMHSTLPLLREEGRREGALDRVTQLYHDGRTKHFLLTFPELDHFPDRAGGDYRGALPYGLGGQPFERPHVGEFLRNSHPGLGETGLHSACIFAYLKPFPALEEFLRLLSSPLATNHSPLTTIAYIDGIPTSRLAKFQTDRLRFAAGPVDIRQAAEGCDAAITNGNSATCTAMLLAGKPLVSVPLFLEQGMFAAAVQRLGAGLTVSTTNARAILAAVNEVLANPSYATAARSFADRYKKRQPRRHPAPNRRRPGTISRRALARASLWFQGTLPN